MASHKSRNTRKGKSFAQLRKQRIAKREAKRKEIGALHRQASRLAEYVPSLKPIAKKKKWTKAETQRVRYRAKQLAHRTGLRKLTKAQAKKFKKQLIPGTQAIQLAHISPEAKLAASGEDMLVTSNGNTWILWRLDRDVVRSKRKFGKAAQEAFAAQFPVEKLTELAGKAFKQYRVRQIHLWGPSGPVGQGFANLSGFIHYLEQHLQAGKYITSGPDHTQRTDPGDWVNGLAIMIEPRKEKMK